MTPRSIVDRFAQLGVEVWADFRKNMVFFDARDVELPDDLIDDSLLLLRREPDALFRYLLSRPMGAGFAYGVTAWHAMVVVGRRRYRSLCGSYDRSRADDLTPALPPYSPRQRLCSHCITQMVERELARIQPTPSEREPR